LRHAGLYRKLPFDPAKDFDGVVTAVSGSYVLAVHPGVPFRSVAELIAFAKAKPGQAHLCLGRCRIDGASGFRVLQAVGGRGHSARALSWRGTRNN